MRGTLVRVTLVLLTGTSWIRRCLKGCSRVLASGRCCWTRSTACTRPSPPSQGAWLVLCWQGGCMHLLLRLADSGTWTLFGCSLHARLHACAIHTTAQCLGCSLPPCCTATLTHADPIPSCSRWFYGGLLQDGVAAAQKPAAAGLAWPQPGAPVMVLAMQGREERAEKSGEKVRARVHVSCACMCFLQRIVLGRTAASHVVCALPPLLLPLSTVVAAAPAGAQGCGCRAVSAVAAVSVTSVSRVGCRPGGVQLSQPARGARGTGRAVRAAERRCVLSDRMRRCVVRRVQRRVPRLCFVIEVAPGDCACMPHCSPSHTHARALRSLPFASRPHAARAGDARSGAVLTPYKGQVRSLEHGLRVLAPWFGALGADVSVSSVDGYQGREADVIVFSAVR